MNDATEVLTNLKIELAGKLTELDHRDYGGDNCFQPYGQNPESDAFIDTAVAVFEKHQRLLLDQIEQDRAALYTVIKGLHDLDRFTQRHLDGQDN